MQTPISSQLCRQKLPAGMDYALDIISPKEEAAAARQIAELDERVGRKGQVLSATAISPQWTADAAWLICGIWWATRSLLGKRPFEL